MTGSIANSENGRLLTKRKTHAEVVGATESIQLYSSTEADEIKSLELLKLGKNRGVVSAEYYYKSRHAACMSELQGKNGNWEFPVHSYRISSTA